MTKANTLLKGMQEIVEYKKGQRKLKVTKVVPTVNIQDIRNELHLSQKEFAEAFGFSLGTVRNWEQGSRLPQGPTRVLLQLIEHQPKRMRDEISKLLAT